MHCRSRRRASGHLSSRRTHRLLPCGTLLPAPATVWNCTLCLRTATASCQPYRISQHVRILDHSFLPSLFNDSMTRHSRHLLHLFSLLVNKKIQDPILQAASLSGLGMKLLFWFFGSLRIRLAYIPITRSELSFCICRCIRKMVSVAVLFFLGFHRPSRCGGEHTGS